MKKLTNLDLAELEEIKNKAVSAIEELVETINELKAEAKESYDSRSDKWKESERAKLYDAWINAINNRGVNFLTIKSEINNIGFKDIERPNYIRD